MEEHLSVIEIFRSIQGESTYAGLPCAFLRLAGCNLRCSYCDTRYAAEREGTPMALEDVSDKLHNMNTRLICITGGEPLLQPGAVPLAHRLVELGHTVLIETNGTVDISPLRPETVRVMDVKCPGSGECGKTLMGNVDALRPHDELKFVLCDRRDFDWAVEFVERHGLSERCKVLLSPADAFLRGTELADWLLESGLEGRLQLQLHRILWPDRRRGA